MKLAQIMEDSDIVSGIIVCKTGFTPDTLTYAEYKGIKLVELREAEENDVEFRRTFEIGTLETRANITVMRPKIICIDLGTTIITGEAEIMAMYGANFHDAQGRKFSFAQYVVKFSDELKNSGELLKTTTMNLPLNDILFWANSSGVIAVEKLSITGYLIKIDHSFKRSFLLTDQVWMIMKELFDERKFTLSKSGLIWNLPSDN